MEENETAETETLQESSVKPKYKDPHTFLCSVRWRMGGLMCMCYLLLYCHRVNLSLAVVCMVDTTRQARDVTLPPTHSNFIYNNNISLLNSSVDYPIATVAPVDEVKLDDRDSDVRGTNVGKASGNLVKYSTGTDNDTGTVNKVRHRSTQGRYDGRSQTPDTYTGTDLAEVSMDQSCTGANVEQISGSPAELHWEKSDISFLLSSYFYGSFFTQIPAGTLADMYGGKHIMTAAMLLTAVCSLLTPLCARAGITWMFILRVCIGLAGGAVIPAGTSMIATWAPGHEIPSMLTFASIGLLMGTILTYMTSGLLCAYGFDNGWPSIFYIHGGITLLFTIVWVIEAASSPSKHPRISPQEVEFINKDKGSKKKHQKAPWRHIFTSVPMWASFVAHFCFNYSFFTVLMNIPLFLKEVLKFDVKSNGLYSSLPFMFQIISGVSSSKIASSLIRKGTLGHLFTRRMFQVVCFIGVACCLVATGYVTCEHRMVAVVLLCLSSVFGGMACGGFLVNHPEYGGQYSGTLFGITNAGGVISSLLASMCAGLLTPNGRQEEWQTVFYIAAGVDLVGAIVFLCFSDVYIQDWAKPKPVQDQDGHILEQATQNMTIFVEETETNT